MFDINSPEALFRTIRRSAHHLHNQTAKDTDGLLFVIFGLNHLREWIAPKYDWHRSPNNENERFSQLIWYFPSYQLVRTICNHAKHLSPIGPDQTAYGLKIDDWPDLDSVQNFNAGPPTAYEIDGRDVLDVVAEVIEFYQRNWFDQHTGLAK